MNVTKLRGAAEIGRSLEMALEQNVPALPRASAPPIDNEGSSEESLEELLIRVSEHSKLEIDNLIDELRMLRAKLESDSDRIQREIVNYEAVSDHVMQLTKIISESMHKLPEAPGIAPS